MRMVLEHLRGCLVGRGANHGEGTEFVAVIRNTSGTDPLGLAERPAHLGERRLMFLTHAFQAATPSFSLALRSASDSAFHAANFVLFLLPTKTAR